MKKINGDEPATQHDLAIWGGELTRRIDGLQTQIDQVKHTMATKDDLKQLKDEIFHHFDAAVENIEDDLTGANRDEISSIQDKQRQHEERITMLERRGGLAP